MLLAGKTKQEVATECQDMGWRRVAIADTDSDHGSQTNSRNQAVMDDKRLFRSVATRWLGKGGSDRQRHLIK